MTDTNPANRGNRGTKAPPKDPPKRSRSAKALDPTNPLDNAFELVGAFLLRMYFFYFGIDAKIQFSLPPIRMP